MPRSYTDRTLKLLWGRSGGRCTMPECRVELTRTQANTTPLSSSGRWHTVAASHSGPRAAPLMSAEDRNNYDNLILLCRNCHARIDGQPGAYSIERLKEIKAAHEAWVRASLPERGRSSTGSTLISLQGNHVIDLATAEEALAPDFIADMAQEIRVPTNTDNWQAVDMEIASQVQRTNERRRQF